MEQRALITELASSFSIDLLRRFFREASDKYKPDESDLSSSIINNNESIKKLLKIGHIEKSLLKIGQIDFDEVQQLIIVAGKLEGELTSRTSRALQYKIGKEILKKQLCEAGIFVFYDEAGNFRFSLITAIYLGHKREFSYYRRYTYFVSPILTNKTFYQQIGKADFTSIETIQKAFSIEAVTNDFYGEFEPKFKMLAKAVKGDKVNEEIKQNFALLFAIRLIFIGFVQKRGWLGKKDFILSFWQEYRTGKNTSNTFYKRWLEPLFFEALNTPPGHKVMFGNNEFCSETEDILQMAPYLNGELFKRIKDVDDRGLYLLDDVIEIFIDFLFQYNFTIEENNRYDEELELNPEFLGIIFERLVNKEDGAVYTPRIEVDFMCRLALVKWLEKSSACRLADLYYLFFREEDADKQIGDISNNSKDIDFSSEDISELCRLLENVKICDPAAGSGAFEVGMLQVLSEALQYLQCHPSTPTEALVKDNFTLKKELIANCLYGVEVKQWAVWINQLRLWLTLFIDMPDEYKNSFEPLLPSLNFKICCGDSLVQQIAGKTFPIEEHAGLSSTIKRKITELKKDKVDFFYNRIRNEILIKQKELQVFRDILDEEIMKRENTILFYKKKENYSQDSIFGEATENKQKRKTVYDQDMLDALETEIEALREQKSMLKSEYPFIWNIEFAEVFFQDNKNRQGFDIIIGNPPYVRQEGISDPNSNMQPSAYKAALIEMAKSDYEYFSKDKKIDGRSDLYTFFFLRSLKLLNPNGTHCFICSNSWLDAGYGVWLQEFLLNNVSMQFIIDNHAKRSFASADVNTVISVFDAPGSIKTKSKKPVKFVAFKKPFEDVVYTEVLLEIETTNEVFRNENFRLYPISTEQLLNDGCDLEGNNTLSNSGKQKYIGDKWGGKYLKAPDIFLTIMKKTENKFEKLGDVADIRFGIKSGCNDFFYLSNDKVQKFNIEEKYLKPIIKNPRESKNIHLNNSTTYKIIYCNEGPNKIKNTNIQKYISYGQKIKVNERPSVKGRKNWWNIGHWEPAHCFWMESINDINRVYLNQHNIFESDKFYGITFYDRKWYREMALSLNSTIYAFFRELLGFHGMGQGVLKLPVRDVKTILFINCRFDKINLSWFNRDQESIFIECGINPNSTIPIEKQEPKVLPDRAALDKIVFDALNLTEEERIEVYRAVCRLVWNRVSKAKSV